MALTLIGIRTICCPILSIITVVIAQIGQVREADLQWILLFHPVLPSDWFSFYEWALFHYM